METKNAISPVRKLFIDFELYTDGDHAFKLELIKHMIDNLRELYQSYEACVTRDEIDPFEKTCHKIKTTLVMVADTELNDLVEDLKRIPPDTERSAKLERISKEIIASLVHEENL